jgi:serine phosphatase RsbU (regulator of sigma subunit)
MESSRKQTMAQAEAQRVVEKELDQAGIIQGTFLPESPVGLAGWQFAVSLLPARQTTGDFYDFIPMPDGRLGIVIADVADKGMGAALYMTTTRTLLRTYAPQFVDAPEKAVAAANQRLVADTRRGLFVTLFYGVLDHASGKFIYCNAGHNPPYLVTPIHAGDDRFLTPLTNTGVAVGIFADASYERGEISLPPGAVLALYTDGITEAISTTEEGFGVQRLEDTLLGISQPQPDPSQFAEKIRTGILDAVNRFRGAAPQSDDITLMVIVREP